MTSAAELGRIVETNREIQRVVEVASSLEIVAFNASVLSLRAGSEARGFGVASSELRRFSNALDAEMTKLREATVSASMAVSKLLLAERHLRLFLDAGAAAPDSPHVKRVLAEKAVEIERMTGDLRDQQRRVASRLREIKLFAQIGWALSRTARIEAASATTDNEALSAVAEQFATAMEAVLGGLGRLAV